MIPSHRSAIPLVPALLLVWSCGGDSGVDTAAFQRACEDVPGCAESRSAEAGPRETIYRVEVVRSGAGQVSIERVEAIAVPEGDGVPLGRLAGTHMVVGLDGDGEPLDGQVIAFPKVLRAELADGWTTAEIDLADREVDAFGYVRAIGGIEEIAVLDDSGEVVARADAPGAGTADHRPGGPSGSAPGLAMGVVPAAFAQDGGAPPLPAQCSHVRILEGEADRDLARGVDQLEGVRLVEPGPTMRALIHGALGMVTPLLCHGISRIAVVDLPEQPGLGGQVQQLSSGDLLMMNVAARYSESELEGSEALRLDFMKTLIHEVAHGAEALLNVEGSPPDAFTGDWTPPSRDLAAETIDRVRLEKGLIIEWQRVHRSFVGQGWAAPYTGTGPEKQVARDRSGGEAVSAGFMSRYGGVDYAEDIAEAVVWTYIGDEYRAAGIPPGLEQGSRKDFGCQEMQAHDGDGVPSRFASVYTKLHFVKDLGLVRPEDVDDCTGAVALPNDEPGFHFWQDGEYQRTFGRAVTAVIGTAPSGNYVYEMKAEGEATFGDETHPARVRLVLELAPGGAPLEKVAWPRGVYDLGLLAGYDLGNIANRSRLVRGSGFSLRLEGAAAGNFDVYEGYALVAEASDERIAGSVVVQRAMRLSAPLPVPQTWDPPLVVRFAIEK